MRKKPVQSYPGKIFLEIYRIRIYPKIINLGGEGMKMRLFSAGIILSAAIFVLTGYQEAWSGQKTVRFKVPGIG